MSLTNFLLLVTALGVWGISGPPLWMLFRMWLIQMAHPPHDEHEHERHARPTEPNEKFYRLDMTPDVFAKHLPYFQKSGLVKGGDKKADTNGHGGTYL